MIGIKDHLRVVEVDLATLQNLVAALSCVANPIIEMNGSRLSQDEIDARDGLVGMRDALKEQVAKLGEAFEATWRAAP